MPTNMCVTCVLKRASKYHFTTGAILRWFITSVGLFKVCHFRTMKLYLFSNNEHRYESLSMAKSLHHGDISSEPTTIYSALKEKEILMLATVHKCTPCFLLHIVICSLAGLCSVHLLHLFLSFTIYTNCMVTGLNTGCCDWLILSIEFYYISFLFWALVNIVCKMIAVLSSYWIKIHFQWECYWM